MHDKLLFPVTMLISAGWTSDHKAHSQQNFYFHLYIAAGLIYRSPDNMMPMNTVKTIANEGFPNVVVIPDISTLHELPWAGGEDYRVAEVLGTTYMSVDGRPVAQGPSPREAALRQLRRLEERGLSLLSGTEMEFRMLKQGTREPHFTTPDICCHLSFALQEDVLFYMEDNLHRAGINIELMNTEYAAGQYEFNIKPEPGIKAADAVFCFKNSMKELAIRKSMEVSFLTKDLVGPGECGNSAHFNFSIWDNKNNNILFDPCRPDGVSARSYHWLSGLVKHTGALTALCAPTVNCYRRFHQHLTPHLTTWGLDNRESCFRLKIGNESSTYIENRLPSALSNPYLVMAGTIAAGLDGVDNELKCPNMLDEDAECVPEDLEQALDALERDTTLRDVLGHDLVDVHIGTKREHDLLIFKDHNVHEYNETQILAERSVYEKFM